jgi:hypothetical protein
LLLATSNEMHSVSMPRRPSVVALALIAHILSSLHPTYPERIERSAFQTDTTRSLALQRMRVPGLWKNNLTMAAMSSSLSPDS